MNPIVTLYILFFLVVFVGLIYYGILLKWVIEEELKRFRQ